MIEIRHHRFAHGPQGAALWLFRPDRRQREAVALVGEERERAWRLYMLASAIGFDDGEITVYQVLAANGSPHTLPLNRAELLGVREQSEEPQPEARPLEVERAG